MARKKPLGEAHLSDNHLSKQYLFKEAMDHNLRYYTFFPAFTTIQHPPIHLHLDHTGGIVAYETQDLDTNTINIFNNITSGMGAIRFGELGLSKGL